MEKKVLLKILSGPHLGAEILLREGEYVVGSDDHCDIVLNDIAMAPRHARLSLSGEGVHITPLEGSFSMAGTEAEEEGLPLDFFHPAVLGSTYFALGPAEEKWPAVVVPETLPGQGKEESPGTVQESAGGEEKEPGEHEDLEANSDYYGRLKSKITAKPAIFSGGVLFVIVLLLFFAWHFARTEEQKKPLPDQEKIARVQRELKSLNCPDLKAAPSENGAITITGYVQTREQEQKIIEAFKKSSYAISYAIKPMEKLADSARGVMEAHGLAVKVKSGGPGVIILKGYVTDQAGKDKAICAIREDLPAVSRIEDQTLSRDEMEADVSEVLEKFGLKGKIRVEALKGHILATGSLIASETADWKQAREALQQRYEDGPLIKETIEIKKPERSKSAAARNRTGLKLDLTLPIKGVNLEPNKYITLEGGAKYFEGGRMENGWTIKSITSDHMVLSRDGREMIYYFGRNP